MTPTSNDFVHELKVALEAAASAGDYLKSAYEALTPIANAFTFEAWMKPSVYAWGNIWSQYPNESGGNVLYDFAITDTGVLLAAAYLDDIWTPIFTTVTLPLNAWTHVALTYDGAHLRIFVDGLEVASRPAHGSIAVTSQPNMGCCLRPRR